MIEEDNDYKNINKTIDETTQNKTIDISNNKGKKDTSIPKIYQDEEEKELNPPKDKRIKLPKPVDNPENKDPEASGNKKLKYGLIIGGIVIALVLIITLSVTLPKKNAIHPFRPLAPPGPPALPDPSNAYFNTYLISGDHDNDGITHTGFIISDSGYNPYQHANVLNKLLPKTLKASNPHDLYLNPRLIPEGPNNRFIQNASFYFGMTNYRVAYLQITDAQRTRYQVPDSAIPNPQPSDVMRLEMMGFQLFSNPFAFAFVDVNDDKNVFLSTQQQSLVLMDKFLQMDFLLPSQRIFGFGERQHEFMLGEGTWTMWAKGQNSIYDDGTGGKQSFGVHPFVMIQGKNKGDYFGIFFRNSNAQSPVIKYNADGTSILSYITTGGQLEIYFFIHDNAKSIIKQYQNFIGNPSLPPFWALGWHQGSGTYKSQAIVEDVIKKYRDANLMLESIFLDLSYLQAQSDFQVDKAKFTNMIGLSDELHQFNQHLVIEVESSLSCEDGNSKYLKLAQSNKCLLQSVTNPNVQNGNLVSQVGSELKVFLDWFSYYGVSTVWYTGLLDLFSQAGFDGIQFSSNEAATVCNGECFTKNTQQSLFKKEKKLKATNDKSWYYSFQDQEAISTYDLPFIPGYFQGGNLDTNTLSLNATHVSIQETEYDLHNLFGLMMSIVTREFLTNKLEFFYPDNRPFIVSRSTFAGQGAYSSHSITNNYRNWNDLKYSISGIMSMNMFGIPHSGADVCGFYGTRDDELCNRWIQLAAYYPLARFNYDASSESNEPYLMKDQTIVKSAMMDRYQYLRLMYTCLFKAHKSGGTCFDPMFYYFPTDDNLFKDIESTFIVGGAIKVTPILQQGATTVNAYFPISGYWVNLYDYSEIIDASVKSVNVALKDKPVANAHLRPGTMIPFQDQKDQVITSTSSLVYGAISLIINRNLLGVAKGTLLLDGGISISEIDTNQYEYFKFEYSSKSINKLFEQGTFDTEGKYSLSKIVILNAAEANAGGDLSKTDFACYVDFDFVPVPLNYVFDATKKTLTLTPLPPEKDKPQVNFNSFKTIHFGEKAKDINLCDPTMYNYQLATGILPVLTGYTTTFSIMSMVAPTVLPALSVTLTMQAPTIVNIKWTYQTITGKRTAFQIPTAIVLPVQSPNARSTALSNIISISDNPFTITVKSLKGDKVMDFTGMIYDQWLNIIKTTLFANPAIEFTGIFGLGERVSDQLEYENGVYSMWARDTADPFETGKPPGNNVYGVHPFYMYMNDFQSWIGVYTNNANAQDWFVENDLTSGQTHLTTISTGGIADIYVMVGHDPKQIVADYWNYIIGRPVLPPVYALGWNQCRWGYKTVQDLYDVVGNYQLNGIPLDVQWSDIDYLFDYRDFTFDTIRYDRLPNFIQFIHSQNISYVPIIDEGIASRPFGNYNTYQTGIDKGIFLKSNAQNPSPFIGSVWPNDAVYPDWFNPSTQSWWLDNLNTFYNKVNFDGIWLDMNEASNFCDGACYESQKSTNSVLQNLKYIPTNRDLEDHGIAVDAIHYNGNIEFDTHSLFGSYETMNTYQYFVNSKKRPFIISRSSFAGSGKYGSRWLGDNWSQIEYLEASISGIMTMNMFGYPLVGTDICGFMGDTTPELCARWTVVGAFFPFSRNHNGYGYISQEPYATQFQLAEYEQGLTYSQIMIQGIRNKYHMIRYYYTHMFMQSMYGTGPFFNPMFFSFPEDINAFHDTHLNIMLGPALKLSVQTASLGMDQTQFYFPKGTWCNVFNNLEPCFHTDNGVYKTMQTRAYDFYVHLLVGYIVPMQDATLFNVNNTVDLQRLPIDFHVLGQPNNKFGYAWYAQGIYVNDDGVEPKETIVGNFNQYSLTAKAELADPSKITVEIDLIYLASNHKEVLTTCNAVNNNDFLGSIFFYNANALGANGKYVVMALMKDGSQNLVGEARYTSKTDQLILRATATKICLPDVTTMTFTLFV